MTAIIDMQRQPRPMPAPVPGTVVPICPAVPKREVFVNVIRMPSGGRHSGLMQPSRKLAERGARTLGFVGCRVLYRIRIKPKASAR